MKTKTERVWFWYSLVGAALLSCVLYVITRPAETQVKRVDGVVQQIIEAEWDNRTAKRAVIETADDKGSVVANLYAEDMKVGDEVSLKIRTSESSDWIHATILTN